MRINSVVLLFLSITVSETNAANIRAPQVAEMVKFTYMAAVFVGAKFTCSGAILSKYHVLVPAHSVFNVNEPTVRVYYKTPNLEDLQSERQRAVKKITVHPHYDYDPTSGTYYNNIAIIEIRFPFGVDGLRVVHLPVIPAKGGSVCTYSGWGVGGRHNYRSAILMREAQRLYNERDYFEIYSQRRKHPTELFAKSVTSGQYHMRGENGAPLVCKGDVIFGMLLGTPPHDDQLSIYLDLTKYILYILNEINKRKDAFDGVNLLPDLVVSDVYGHTIVSV